MKTFLTLFLFALLFLSCNTKKSEETTTLSSTIATDTTQTVKPTVVQPEIKQYVNDRFRQVTIEKIDDNKFRVQGQAQVFEANINWAVEDGHNELKKGYTTATIGAPEWGDFDFTFEVKKANENSTLNLILFEESAKDGSHQHELMIPLE